MLFSTIKIIYSNFYEVGRSSIFFAITISTVLSLANINQAQGDDVVTTADDGITDWITETYSRSNLPSRPKSISDNDYFEPFFDNNTSGNVTVQLGETAYLKCSVHHLGERTVTWMRQRDLHILTVGVFTYINDNRFVSHHDKGSELWILEIKNTRKNDSGVYECVISTEDTKTLQIHLNIVASTARILEDSDLYVQTGSSIMLNCEVFQAIYRPEYIFWYHNNSMVHNGDRNGRVNIFTDHINMIYSKLSIINAHKSDTGEYSCKPSSASAANITIGVLNGEETAAMQHGEKSYQPQLMISLQVWTAFAVCHIAVLSV